MQTFTAMSSGVLEAVDEKGYTQMLSFSGRGSNLLCSMIFNAVKNTFNFLNCHLKSLTRKHREGTVTTLIKKTTQFLNDQRIEIDVSPKKTYAWPVSTRKCSAALIVKEMQTGTVVRGHVTPTRAAIIEEVTTVLEGGREMGSLI